MSFYLPNSKVRPTGAEIAEYVDTIPPEFEAVTDPPPFPPPADADDPDVGDDEGDDADDELPA